LQKVDANEYNDYVNRNKPEEPPRIEPAKVYLARLGIFSKQDRPYKKAANNEEQINPHRALAHPLRPRGGENSLYLFREGSEMEKYDVQNEYPKNGNSPYAVYNGFSRSRTMPENR
jgi:hypothetical protein